MGLMEYERVTYNTYCAPFSGGLFFFSRNYSISDYTIPSQYYIGKTLLWWSQFRETFATEDWKAIIWNNKEIKVDNKPVYCKNYFNARITFTLDLWFSLNSTDSYNQLSKKHRQNKYFRMGWSTQVHTIIATKQLQVPLHKRTNICGGW